MSSLGIDAETGALLSGWDHVKQSLARLVTTEIGTRVERRDYGSDIPPLIDRPQNTETALDYFMAVAEAIYPRRINDTWYGEPRFITRRIYLDMGTPGSVTLAVDGDYYPRGHMGDFSRAERKSIRFGGEV